MNQSLALNLALAGCLFCFLAGCASTKVSHGKRLVNESLPRPDVIYVCSFTDNPADIPTDSTVSSQVSKPDSPPTSQESATGRLLGNSIAAKLVAGIQDLGLPAKQVSSSTMPMLQMNDMVLKGYFISINKGSAAKRMSIGFGAGGSELTTLLEGFQMTSQGLRKLGSGTIESKGNKGAGAAWLIAGGPVGFIVAGGVKIYGETSNSANIEGRAKATADNIIGLLKERFQAQGWITK